MPADQPKLSTRMWVATDERKHTSSPESAANVKLGTTSRARKFTVDATGTLPHSYTVTNPSVTGVTTVKLSAAIAAFAGIPGVPATLSRRSVLAANIGPDLVSSNRFGVEPVKSPVPVNDPIRSPIRWTGADDWKHSPAAAA